MTISWRDIHDADTRDAWHYQEEQTARRMAEIARDIWKDKEKQQAWLKTAEDHRRARWPKDRIYQPIYI